MDNIFSNSCNTLMGKARSEAIKHNMGKITPETILLALLDDEESAAYKAMEQVKTGSDSLAQMRAALDDSLYNLDFTRGDGDTAGATGDMEMDQLSARVFKLSSLEARMLKDSMVEPIHIMLALFHNYDVRNLVGFAPFFSAGIDYTSLHKYVTTSRGLTVKNAGDDEGDDGDDLTVPGERPEGENTAKQRAKATRSGASDTPMLDKFGHDMTRAAKEGRLDPVVGRETEIERLAQILSRRKKNNPVLIGEPGVGKSAIVEGLAMRITQRNVSRILFDKRVIALDMASIVAGTKYRGEFEERIKAILNELSKNSDIILFIDEIHTIVGAGNAQGSMDAANMLKPALARGEVQCIGATTLDEYRVNIEKDGALERRFQKVMVEPTTAEETLTILRNIKNKYEDHHNVTYTDDALEACVKLTERYISDRKFPDKAIDALDEAGSRAHISNIKAPAIIEELEKKVEEATQMKLEAARAQKFEIAAMWRDKSHAYEDKLAEAKSQWEKQMDEDRTIVDADKVAEVVAMMTGVPVQRIAQAEGARLLEMSPAIKKAIIGQDKAIETVVKAIQRNRIGLKDPNRPIGTFMFLGPTGVGKTHLAKKLAEFLFDSAETLIRIDMSEYMEKFTVSRLVGAPPGYVGYDEGGQLTEAVRRHPYSVVLLDEIEKAHPDVFNLLLQVMDEGRLTDSLGRRIDFKNTIIIMTSNIGSRQLKDFGAGVGFNTRAVDNDYAQGEIHKALNKAFSPEFLNRVDDVVIFDQLDRDAIYKIIDIELSGFHRRLSDLGYVLQISDAAKAYIADKGYDSAYGARPLRRAIQKYLEDPLAELILGATLQPGGTVVVDYDKDTDKITTKVE